MTGQRQFKHIDVKVSYNQFLKIVKRELICQYFV